MKPIEQMNEAQMSLIARFVQNQTIDSDMSVESVTASLIELSAGTAIPDESLVEVVEYLTAAEDVQAAEPEPENKPGMSEEDFEDDDTLKSILLEEVAAIGLVSKATMEDPEKKTEAQQEIEDTFERKSEDYPDKYQIFFEVDGTKYSAIMSEKMAENIAVRSVKNMIDTEGAHLFNKDFLKKFLFIDDTTRRIMSSEEVDHRFSGMESVDIIERYGTDEEKQEIQALQDEGRDSDYKKLLEKITERGRDELYEEEYEALADPVKHFVTEQGIYTLEELLKASFVSIDEDKMARESVRIDGWAHTLSTYDGESETTPRGLVVFRD